MTKTMGRRFPGLRASAFLASAFFLAPQWTACRSAKDGMDIGPPDAAVSGMGGGPLGSGAGGILGSGGSGAGTGGAGGDSSSSGGTAGVPGSGGNAIATGGAGGSLGSGGKSGMGGNSGTGGKPGTGGTSATGGVLGAGGGQGAGGLQGTGGGQGTGGLQGTGGAKGTGGLQGTGGVTITGGVKGRGGATTTGGSSGTGGSQAGIDGSVQIPAGAPGNPDGHCVIPAEAQPEDVSSPTTVVGTGTPDSCTGDAFVAAVAKGGVITFDCGPGAATVRLSKPAKVFNDKGPKIVIDGGGKVTLSGEGVTRILYMNTCDEAQVWTSSHCDNQDTPRLTVQNLAFANGNSKNESNDDGGGAIYASGGRLKVINSRFTNNICSDAGPDLGGGAIRAFQQYNNLPLYVVNSTFGGSNGLGNVGSNGGALSSIGVSWTVLNTVISYNHAIGSGGNPASSGTPGGGSGGGIYNDGNTMTLTLCGTRMEYNQVNAYGSAIFFVSNDHTGNVVIDSSVITNNIGGSWYPTYPQISNHDDTPITVTNSTIE